MNLKEKIIDSPFFNLSIMIIGYLFFSVLFFTLFKIIKFNDCLLLSQILSLIIPLIILILKVENKKYKIILIVVYLFITVALPFGFGRTYDLTIDGNSYHKTAIGFLKDGWNPIYESSKDFQKNNKEVPEIEKVDLWIDHYPKATWIISANIYSMTGNIESGKSLTTMLAISLFCLAYGIVSNVLNKKKAFLISFSILLNPIIITQIFNYYVDGILGIMFLLQILLFVLIEKDKKNNILLWAFMCAVISLFANLKFTGLIYSGIISAIYYFYWIIKNRKAKEFIKDFFKLSIKFIIIYLTAILLIGSSSYLKNTIDHHNPLYPLIGKDKADIVTTMQPKTFADMSTLQKFSISVFSKTENVTYDSIGPTLKVPFLIYKSEIENLSLPDTRIGGFGPWFAMLFVISLFSTIFLLFKAWKNKGRLIYIYLIILAIFLPVLLLGESWWARYVPQLYFISTIALFLLAYFNNLEKNKKIYNILFIIIFSILFINASFFVYSKKQDVISFVQIRTDLREMANNPDLSLQLTDESLFGLYYNFKDYNIKYKYETNIKEENIRYMYSWKIKVDNNE